MNKHSQTFKENRIISILVFTQLFTPAVVVAKGATCYTPTQQNCISLFLAPFVVIYLALCFLIYHLLLKGGKLKSTKEKFFWVLLGILVFYFLSIVVTNGWARAACT